ncbi:hypothetical protein ACFXHB_44800, partial [Kitasatospora sp. NPDC059327]
MRPRPEALAGAAPTWLAGRFGADRVAERELRYTARINSWRLPSSQTKRDRLAQVYGHDALITPRLVDHSHQARAAEGFDKAAFRVDWNTRQVN